MLDLKPCPFCGTVPHTEANNALLGGRVVVHDGPEECPLDGGHYRVERWNRRSDVEIAQLRKALEQIVAPRSPCADAWDDVATFREIAKEALDG